MATAPTSTQIDPESLVARIISELQASPEAQKLLLRTLLTEEFLSMPVRLERMETDIETIKADVGTAQNDIATLKGDSLEGRLHRKIRPILSQRLGLRRARMMQGPFTDTSRELFGPVEEALDSGRISDSQETRISDTDIILQAVRKEDRSQIWVAVDASNNIAQSDIERVRQSAEALGVVFGQDTIAVVAGYNIHPLDQERADGVGVAVILIEENN
ncbi:MAG: hypothetical protein OXC95_16320 [Dehalococcoidia bacterium]|nr:hypothetical protein [Dehalococcoidia bacterium]